MSRLKLALAVSLLTLAASGQANAQRYGRVKATSAKPVSSKQSLRSSSSTRAKSGATLGRQRAKVQLRPSKSAALRTKALDKSITARQLKNSALPSRIQKRVLKDIGTLTEKSVLQVSESQKTFGTQIVYKGNHSKFVKGQGHVNTPTETKVLLKGPNEITVTRTWGREVGSVGGQLVVGTNRGYGPKQREHQYSVSPNGKGTLLEMSTASEAGRIVNRRAYEVNAKTGKRIKELEQYRVGF